MGPLISCGDVTHTQETLNCSISSLENDTEMVDHTMNPKFPGPSYESCYFFLEKKKKLIVFKDTIGMVV